MRVYTIVENCFEYNDEYHYPGEGSVPVKAYRSEASAQAECKRLNEQAFAHNSPFAYSDEVPFSEDDLPRIRDIIATAPPAGLENIEDIDDVSDVSDWWDDLTAEQCIELWKISNDYNDTMFFDIHEMEVEDCRTISEAR